MHALLCLQSDLSSVFKECCFQCRGPAGHRPYDVAMRLGYRSIAWALNPRVPLETLLQRSAAPPRIPTLAALAAAALRHRLSARLRELEGVILEAQNNNAAAELAHQSSSCLWRDLSFRRLGGSRAGSREGSAHGATGYAAFAVAASASNGSLPAASTHRLSNGSRGDGSLAARQSWQGSLCGLEAGFTFGDQPAGPAQPTATPAVPVPAATSSSLRASLDLPVLGHSDTCIAGPATSSRPCVASPTTAPASPPSLGTPPFSPLLAAVGAAASVASAAG
jgi:hypothetical protein